MGFGVNKSSRILCFIKAKLANLRRHFFGFDEFSTLLQTPKISTQCQSDFKEFINSLMNFELWALESKFSAHKK